MVLTTLWRLVLVPLAFVLAALVGGLVLVMVGQERIVQGMAARPDAEVTLGGAFDLMRMARTLFSVETLLPPLLLVVVGEIGRIRSALYYVVGGGIALAAVPFLTRFGQGSPLAVSAVVWQVFATAGFAAGYVYWLLAGRRA
ncbi:MAG: hypothetical protein KGP27_09670 [Hyphomicrobiales bacterium]|nr:hypothetical protein [Hyphomicrobiales bacterium]